MDIDSKLAQLKLEEGGQDPWGLDPQYCYKALKTLYPLYRHYFRVRVFGGENVGPGPYVFVANHSGQIAIDGLLVIMALALEVKHSRIARPMVERFVAKLPFVAEASFRLGAVLGDRQNCLRLLEHGQSVLVFPEGVRGVAKSTSRFYQLQPFTKGFLRMACSAQTSVLPIAVVGAEELYPFVYQAKGLAKLLGLPALPITPFFPWLGPLGAIPLPSPIDIHIGPAISLPKDLDEDAPDNEIAPYIEQVEQTIHDMLEEGIQHKREFIDPQKILERLGIKR